MSKGNRVSDERLTQLVNAAERMVRMAQWNGETNKKDWQERLALVSELQSLRSKPVAGVEDDADEAYEIGKRDGYERAVQDIDRLTGGDGEYRYCSDHDPERHTPDADTMKARISDRFSTLSLPAQEPEEDEGSRQAAVDIADAVIKWMVKHDLLDPEHEYFDHDIIEVLNDFAPAEETRILYRHQKRGTVYELIGIGKMQAENWEEREYTATDEPTAGASVDMREVAVYRSADNPDEIWVRPREEFQDGRFDKVDSSNG